MTLRDLDRYNHPIHALNQADSSIGGGTIDDGKLFAKKLHAIFAENVNEIHLQSKRSNEETQARPSFKCKLKKDFIFLQETKSPGDPVIEYSYTVHSGQLFKNNTLATTEVKTLFFKELVKIFEWAESDKIDLQFK